MQPQVVVFVQLMFDDEGFGSFGGGVTAKAGETTSSAPTTGFASLAKGLNMINSVDLI